MIDLHCHILPGIDDGPATLSESVAMCRIATNDGITTIVATPHFRPGWFAASAKEVSEGITALTAALLKEGVNIHVLPGAEVAVLPELASYLNDEAHLSINGTRRYFLAELPHDSVPPRWDDFLLCLLGAGKVPVLSHPERNPWFMNHPDTLSSFVLRGGMVQITAASLTGQWGKETREFSQMLLRRRLVHVISTDAHSCDVRPPLLSQAVKTAAEIIGLEEAQALVTTIPQAIIEGRSISLPEPVQVEVRQKRKTWIQRLVFQ